MKTRVPVDDVDAMLKRLHLPTIRRLHADLAIRAEQDGMCYRTYSKRFVQRRTRIACIARKHALEPQAHPFLRTVEEFDFTCQSSVQG